MTTVAGRLSSDVVRRRLDFAVSRGTLPAAPAYARRIIEHFTLTVAAVVAFERLDVHGTNRGEADHVRQGRVTGPTRTPFR